MPENAGAFASRHPHHPRETPGGHVPEQIIYEHPVNEKTRTLLRLEHLFDQVAFHMPIKDPWNSRVAVGAILDVISIVSRTDLKSDLLKELERHLATFGRIARAPGIDVQRLEQVLGRLGQCRDLLNRHSGTLAQGLRDHELLKAVQQRAPIPGGSCAFDLPLFHFWLGRPHSQRVADLQDWLQELSVLEQTMRLLLTVIRGSAENSRETASQGFFQMSLDPQVPVHLVRVAVPASLDLFAEISGGKHRFSIRFMAPKGADRAVQSQEDVAFTLACCAI
jgi:cell division protein ZapD